MAIAYSASDDVVYDRIRANIIRLVRQRNMTLTDLAQASGFSQPSISNFLLHRKRGLMVHSLCMLATALDVSMDDLLSERTSLE